MLNFEHRYTVYTYILFYFSFIAIVVKCLYTRVPRGLTGCEQLIKYVYIKKKLLQLLLMSVGTGIYAAYCGCAHPMLH